MAILKSPPLEERIEKLRAEIDAFIDARVAETKKGCPGIPEAMLRRMATARAAGCQCAQYLQLKQDAEERAA
jgi:hypothetical protein